MRSLAGAANDGFAVEAEDAGDALAESADVLVDGVAGVEEMAPGMNPFFTAAKHSLLVMSPSRLASNRASQTTHAQSSSKREARFAPQLPGACSLCGIRTWTR